VPDPTDQRRVLRFGVFEVDVRSGELRKQGVRLRLQGRPFELLAALLDRPGELVTREELRRRLWPAETFVDFDHGLNNAVNRIREALGDRAGSPRFIETLPRRGYRFIAPVEDLPSAPAPSSDARPRPARRRGAGLWAAAALLVVAGASAALLLNGALGPSAPVATGTPDSPAYQAYLKGRYHQRKPDPASWRQARQFFEDAVRLDAAFARGHAALAATLNQLGASGVMPPGEALPQAHAAAERALALDPRLAEALLALGTAKLRMDWDWPGAERAYREAIASEPDLSSAHHNYALLLAARGRWDESLAAIARARDLNPLDVAVHADAGRVLYLARRYDEAIAQLTSTLEFEPRHPAALKLLSDAYLRKGMRREAAGVFARWLEAVGVREDERSVAARLLAEGGTPRLARRNLTNPAGKRLDAFGVPMKVALSHAAIGHRDRALDWLERAYGQKDPRLIFLNVDPDFDPLRGEARFQRLLRHVGLS